MPTTPPLVRNSFRSYRLWSRDHVTFDEGRARFGDAPTVVIDGWSMSTSSICGFLSSPEVAAVDSGEYTLNLRRRDKKHDQLDGARFQTSEDATRAAFTVGALAFMVYEPQTVTA